MTVHALPLLLATKGTIINLSSVGTTHRSMYQGAKGHEDGIATGIPCKRFGEPEKVDKVASFLASDKASYISGAIYAVDSGMGAL